MELNLRLRIEEILGTFKRGKLNVEMSKDILEYINYKCKYTLGVTLSRRVSVCCVFKLRYKTNGRELYGRAKARVGQHSR
jgi:hypothetical protein